MRTIIFTLALLLAQGAAAEGRFDDGFAEDGFAVHGFQPAPVPGGTRDMALAGCAGPSGSLMVSGLASGFARIVTLWLTPAGALDTAFSSDGKESFTLPLTFSYSPVATCLPDGDIVIAHLRSAGAPAEGDLQLVRVDAQTGLPDPGFGGGTVTLLISSGLPGATQPEPTALVPGRNGDLLLAGTYRDAMPGGPAGGVERGFVARVTANGGLAALHGSANLDPGIVSYAALGVPADGSVQAIGQARNGDALPLQLARAMLSYASLAPVYGERYAAPAGLTVDSARMLDEDTLVLAARDGFDRRLVFAEAALADWRIVSLPPLRSPAGATLIAGRSQLAPAPGGGLLLATQVNLGVIHPDAVVVTKLVGAEDGAPVADPTFGDGGSTLVQRAGDQGCGAREILEFRRFTLWRGAVTVVGGTNAGCANDEDIDYAVFRLGDRLFGDRFEARYDLR